MANWYGTARSNYVKLTDEDIIQQLFPGVEIVPYLDRFAILADGTPDAFREDHEEIFERFDFNGDCVSLLDVISLFLVEEPDNVFVWIEVGAEKHRYLSGFTIAIDHTGTILDRISLDEIYEDTNWSRAEY